MLLNKYNYSIGINGAVFTKNQQGIIPQLVLDIYKGRKEKKNKMLEIGQLVIDAGPEEKQELEHQESLLFTGQLSDKLSINSVYGALSQKYFSLFNEDIAAAITGNGRYFIKLLALRIEEGLQKLCPYNGDYMVAGDTDSVYFTIDPFIEKYKSNLGVIEKTEWADRFYNKVVEKIVQDCIKEFSIKLNAYAPEHIGADREIIADSAIFVAKKK